jgi:hypothetical protein
MDSILVWMLFDAVVISDAVSRRESLIEIQKKLDAGCKET